MLMRLLDSANVLGFLATTALVSCVTGCANQQPASFISNEARVLDAADARNVEVLLDRQPERPFRVVGELTGRTIDNGRSIEAMKDRAATAGLDGIYWIDCSVMRSGRRSSRHALSNEVASAR